jgi:hypothetical protein
MEARYQLFNEFALDDQRSYYESTINKYREAASQVNRFRALFAFLTGFAAAVAGFLVQSNFATGARCAAGVSPLPGDCGNLQVTVVIFVILSVAAPAFGAFFSSLADLYQWDRMNTIYDTALENIELADAQSPLDDMDDVRYRAGLSAFAEGTLQVMSDETAQWGQSIRTPPQIEQYVESARQQVRTIGGDADAPKTDPQPPGQ